MFPDAALTPVIGGIEGIVGAAVAAAPDIGNGLCSGRWWIMCCRHAEKEEGDMNRPRLQATCCGHGRQVSGKEESAWKLLAGERGRAQ